MGASYKLSIFVLLALLLTARAAEDTSWIFQRMLTASNAISKLADAIIEHIDQVQKTEDRRQLARRLDRFGSSLHGFIVKKRALIEDLSHSDVSRVKEEAKALVKNTRDLQMSLEQLGYPMVKNESADAENALSEALNERSGYLQRLMSSAETQQLVSITPQEVEQGERIVEMLTLAEQKVAEAAKKLEKPASD